MFWDPTEDGPNSGDSIAANTLQSEETDAPHHPQRVELGIAVPRHSRVVSAVSIATEETNLNTTTTTNAIAVVAETDEPEKVPSPDTLQKKLHFGELAKSPIWVLGLIVYSSANLLNFVALQFAPQSLVAPLGSISLVVNVFAATNINNEKYSWKDVIGGMLIIGGSSMTVAFAGVNSVGSDYNLCVLLKLLQKPATITFLTVTTGCLVALFCFICIVEKNVDPKPVAQPQTADGTHLVLQTTTTTTTVTHIQPISDESNVQDQKQTRRRSKVMIWAADEQDGPESLGFITADALPSNITPNIAPDDVAPRNSDDSAFVIQDSVNISVLAESALKPQTWFSRMKHNLFLALPKEVQDKIVYLRSIHVIPRLKNKIPMSSKLVAMGLPLAYASIGGMMGTLTTLFAKSTIHLLTNSFLGDNEFNSIYSWIIAGVTVFTALGQVYWINMGLERYDALLQIPVFFVVWTVFDVVGGGIYFQEFEGFSTRQYALFVFAVSVIFVGVFILAGRLKQAEEAERKRTKK
ncbi:UNVERIFIED_CONTAM: NIPA-like protein 3 [Siphonaria sp. JEL0065]|nr:NIPA-like protein 3 [Siphonaria sp. JEL0065]